MLVTVSKEFRWEMGHRLPYHETCKNIHGHSYRMIVRVSGIPDANGMVMDFGVISEVVKPIIKQLDHSFMVDPNDTMMHNLLEEAGLKMTAVTFFSTAENIAKWIGEQISTTLFSLPSVSSYSIELFETQNSSAYVEWFSQESATR